MSRLLTIRSKDRNSQSSSSANCKIDLSDYVEVNNKVKLLNFSAVNTVYNFDDTNNTLPFYENATAKEATITNGFYSASTLVTHLKSILDTASAAFATYTVTYSSTTKKITIASTQNFGLQFSSGTNASTSCWRELGFNEADTATNVSTHTGDNCIQLQSLYSLGIIVDKFLPEQRTTHRSDRFSFIIPVKSGTDELINYDSSQFTQICTIEGSRILRSLNIRICRDNGSVLLLNGSDWEMTIEIL